MKRNNNRLFIFALFLLVMLSNCAGRQYDFTLKDTLSIFLIKNESESFFCMPVQYMGDYHVGSFEFSGGSILIGDYEILLKRDELNISVYLKEDAEEDGSSDSGFNPVYLEEKGKILLSKMSEPLAGEPQEDDGKYCHYYIFIEKLLNDDDVKKINNEYEKGNVNSRFNIEYDLVIDNEPQNGCALIDDFEIYDGIPMDSEWFPPNLNFFKLKYLRPLDKKL